jgi:hypothetical protein
MVVVEGRLRRPDVSWGAASSRDLDELIPPNFRPDPQLVETLGSYVGRRMDFSAPRRLELSYLLAKHYIRAWSLPRKTNPDDLLVAMYRRAVLSQKQIQESRQTPQGRWKLEHL